MRFAKILFTLLALAVFCIPVTAQAAHHKTIEGKWSPISFNSTPEDMHGQPEFQISRVGGKWFLQLLPAIRANSSDITVTAADAHSIAYRQDEWMMSHNNGVTSRDYDLHSGYNVVCPLADHGEHLKCISSLFGEQSKALHPARTLINAFPDTLQTA